MTDRAEVVRINRIEVIRTDLTVTTRRVPTVQATLARTGPRGLNGPPGADSSVPGPAGPVGPAGIVFAPVPPISHSVLWADTSP